MAENDDAVARGTCLSVSGRRTRGELRSARGHVGAQPGGDTRKDPGYIRAYPPGVRENGGQYSHATAWVGWAFADLGDAGRAWEVLQFLNPLARSDGPEAVERFLGLRREGDRVRLAPCPPPGWDRWEMRLREEDTEWRIEVRMADEGESGVQSLELDGSPQKGDAFPLRHDGEVHEVTVSVGRPETTDPAPGRGEADPG